jgi:hypothetical protein
MKPTSACGGEARRDQARHPLGAQSLVRRLVNVLGAPTDPRHQLIAVLRGDRHLLTEEGQAWWLWANIGLVAKEFTIVGISASPITR